MSRTFEEEHLRYGNVAVSGLFCGEEDHDVECLQWQQQQTKPTKFKAYSSFKVADIRYPYLASRCVLPETESQMLANPEEGL